MSDIRILLESPGVAHRRFPAFVSFHATGLFHVNVVEGTTHQWRLCCLGRGNGVQCLPFGYSDLPLNAEYNPSSGSHVRGRHCLASLPNWVKLIPHSPDTCVLSDVAAEVELVWIKRRFGRLVMLHHSLAFTIGVQPLSIFLSHHSSPHLLVILLCPDTFYV
ncbi:hypothetical protein PTI98_010406 [Pleurotus ostreatus]|nr:hypothetical protein PTI98_010406 [Pleurotus ostreatus]